MQLSKLRGQYEKMVFRINNPAINMRTGSILMILLFAVMSCQNSSLNYPFLEGGKIEDKYFGVTVSDPYRELENDSSTTTLGWLNAQNELTNSYFDEMDHKEKIRSELSRFS